MFVYERKSDGKFFVYKNETVDPDLIFHGEIDIVVIDYHNIECNLYVQSVARTLIVE